MSTGILDRAAAWWEHKRLEWQMAHAVVDEVAHGWVPTREQVGLPPLVSVEPPAYDVVDIHDQERPVDIDLCTNCGGHGEVIILVEGMPTSRLCGWCNGTGQRGAA